ncbi:MAG: helix-turn-helix domain-containing protein, partial [bacterium]|nr:helix-turn-helix domain-containing protein [bacterium]
KDQLAGNEPETDELDPGDMTVKQRNELILERLQTGDSVADVAEAFGVSKSTVYNIRNAAR